MLVVGIGRRSLRHVAFVRIRPILIPVRVVTQFLRAVWVYPEIDDTNATSNNQNESDWPVDLTARLGAGAGSIKRPTLRCACTQ